MEHDSHEFLLYFLNNLKDEQTEKGAKLPQLEKKQTVSRLWSDFQDKFQSQVDKLFTVIEKSNIECGKCSQSASSIQYYMAFPLQVENMNSLQDSLKYYMRKEQLPDYKCDKCSSKNQCQIRRSLIKLPEIFIFQMQRFSTYPKMRKIRGMVKY